MKRNLRPLLFFILGIFIVSACSTMTVRDTAGISKQPKVFKEVEGSVQSVNNSKVDIITNISEATTSALSFAEKVAQRIVSRSVLLENDEIQIGNQKATIIEVRKNLVTLQFEGSPSIKVGDKIKITVPKHVIAITDFDVIRGHDKSVGMVSLESLTTAIVESGQFNVVEREKIKTVLKELAFGSSGLTDSQKINKLGKLLNADVILTGTFADVGGEWNVNLRLINVSTGVIVSAIEEKTSFKEILPENVRDTSNYFGNFDQNSYNGWVWGYKTYPGGNYMKTTLDKTVYVNNPQGSLRADYKIGANNTGVWNNKKRDWSSYTGIEFYVKSDHEEVIRFAIYNANRKDRFNSSKWTAWLCSFTANTDWKKIRVKFNDLTISTHKIDLNAQGDGALNLDLVERFHFYLSTSSTKPGTSGTFWIDEVKLF